jgi:HAMP domain-containing protein
MPKLFGLMSELPDDTRKDIYEFMSKRAGDLSREQIAGQRARTEMAIAQLKANAPPKPTSPISAINMALSSAYHGYLAQRNRLSQELRHIENIQSRLSNPMAQGLIDINPATGKQWTSQEVSDMRNEVATQYKLLESEYNAERDRITQSGLALTPWGGLKDRSETPPAQAPPSVNTFGGRVEDAINRIIGGSKGKGK